MIGIDLFSGAGGLSLGAEMAGVNVAIAVESDPYAAQTYRVNHPRTLIINEDIRQVRNLRFDRRNQSLVLFGGPPCQGFSTSNQKRATKTIPKIGCFESLSELLEKPYQIGSSLRMLKGLRKQRKAFSSQKFPVL